MTGAMISLVAAAYGHDGCRSSSRCRDAAEQPNEELFWWPSVTPSKSEGAAAVDETVATCAPPGCAGCRGTARPAGPGRSCACSQWRGHTPRFDLDIHAPQGLGKAVCAAAASTSTPWAARCGTLRSSRTEVAKDRSHIAGGLDAHALLLLLDAQAV